MTRAELSKAVEMAKSGEFSGKATIESWDLFNGFALLGFRPVVCTLEHLAALVSWQCIQLDGGVDADALNEIWYFRKRFLVVGAGSGVAMAS